MNIEEYSNKKLFELEKELYESIVITECFGVSDLRLHMAVTNEMDKRGIEIERE